MTNRRRGLAILLLITAGGCALQTTKPVDQSLGPRIRAVSLPVTAVAPGSIVTVSVEADSPDSSRLAYRWQATAGTVSNPALQTTAWIAPSNPYGTRTPVTLTVKVIDDKGRQASQQASLMLLTNP